MTAPLLYRRVRGEARARLCAAEEARLELRGTPFYPWTWLGLLLADQPVVTESSVYGLRRDIAEQPIPASVAGSTLGGETSMQNNTDDKNIQDNQTAQVAARLSGLLYDEGVEVALSRYCKARSEAESFARLPLGGTDFWEKVQDEENAAFALLSRAIAGAAAAVVQAA